MLAGSVKIAAIINYAAKPKQSCNKEKQLGIQPWESKSNLFSIIQLFQGCVCCPILTPYVLVPQ